MAKTKLGGKVWVSLIVFGLFGQIAWVVENMYFNVFLYNTVSSDPNYIAAMVAASAATATVTTLLMGALSDKLGKRKAFITVGYIIWGVSTLSFAFISIENTQKLFPALNAVVATAVLIVLMDCVMTFFGSTANDGAFNAWVTDVTDKTNRGAAEGVLAVMPLLAMLLVFGGMDGMTQKGQWPLFFCIIGGITTLGGLLGLILLKDKPGLQTSKENYFGNIIYGFRPSTIKANPTLYVILCAIAVFNMSIQVFMPYLIIYIQRYLGIDNYALVLGVVLVGASIASVLFGKLMDKVGKIKMLFPCIVVLSAGALGMYFARSMWMVALVGFVMMAGNLAVGASLNAMLRDYTPEGKAGQFQGIRMIFQVLIPMVTGPYLGAAVIKNNNVTYEELGVVKQVPTPNIFLAASIVALLVIVPAIGVIVRMKKEEKERNRA